MSYQNVIISNRNIDFSLATLYYSDGSGLQLQCAHCLTISLKSEVTDSSYFGHVSDLSGSALPALGHG